MSENEISFPHDFIIEDSFIYPLMSFYENSVASTVEKKATRIRAREEIKEHKLRKP